MTDSPHTTEPVHSHPRPYPVMLNLAGKLAAVVGAGTVGRRRAQELLGCGCRVRLIDPQAAADAPAGAEVLAQPYEPRHLAGAALVLACTDDAQVNARVARDARAIGAWVNRCDEPADSDFALPAVHRTANLVLAVGTAAPLPALASAMRDLLAQKLPPELDAFAEALADLRRRLKATEPDAALRRRLLRRLAGPEGLAAFRAAGKQALEAMLRSTTSQG